MEAYCKAHGGFADVWCLVYDFQTLIAGVIAVIVALLALFPVWCQLRDTNLQTRISRRETLATMLRAGLRRHAKVEESIARPLDEVARATSDPVGEPEAIDTEAAFYLEQQLSRVLDWYLVVLADTEPPEIETCKRALKSALDELVETLGEAHWADHNDQQHDEDYIPDEEWGRIVARCAQAKIDAADKVARARTAHRTLKTAQDRWSRSLRDQIAALDRAIAKTE